MDKKLVENGHRLNNYWNFIGNSIVYRTYFKWGLSKDAKGFYLGLTVKLTFLVAVALSNTGAEVGWVLIPVILIKEIILFIVLTIQYLRMRVFKLPVYHIDPIRYQQRLANHQSQHRVKRYFTQVSIENKELITECSKAKTNHQLMSDNLQAFKTGFLEFWGVILFLIVVVVVLSLIAN